MRNPDRFKLTQTGDIHINECSLIDIVKERELSLIKANYESLEDNEAEEAGDLKELLSIAGEYAPLPLWMSRFPSRHFLDEPKKITDGFVLSLEDSSRNKTTLLGCNCGIIECWFLLAKITLTDTTVTWSDFQNFHRDWWEYDLRFTFDRQEYEAGLIIDLNTM